jgi:D-alanyl-D-alanine carboxypeptidase
MKHYLAWLCLLGAVTAQVHAQADSAALITRLQEKLNAQVKQSNLPGGVSASVALPDGAFLTVIAGEADREPKRVMSKDTLLLQGSVGKTYVAAVALQLVHEKKLKLEEKIQTYLGSEPWFAKLPNAQEITVRMLMNHTSGIMRYELNPTFLSDLTKSPAKVWTPAERLQYVFEKKPRFAAGAGFDYSDTNYIVLGMILEKVTGKKIEELITARLLEPLGLKQTVFSNRLTIAGLAQGYAGTQNPFGLKERMLNADGSMIINPQFEWTGGGMASTSADLTRWGKLLYEGKAFDPSLLKTMLEGVKAPMLGRDVHYGLGVILRPTSLGPTYGHSGFFPGYMAELMYWPEHKVAVAVQVNTSEVQKVKPRLVLWCVELGGEVISKGR